MFVLKPEHAAAHRNGDIHIHDLDFLTLTTTCCQIDIEKLFKNGFSTGHGFLREPNDIQSYAALACIAIQSNQNDQHGGQSIPDFDYGMANGVKKTYRKLYWKNMGKMLDFLFDFENGVEKAAAIGKEIMEKDGIFPSMADDSEYKEKEKEYFCLLYTSQPGRICNTQLREGSEERNFFRASENDYHRG